MRLPVARNTCATRAGAPATVHAPFSDDNGAASASMTTGPDLRRRGCNSARVRSSLSHRNSCEGRIPAWSNLTLTTAGPLKLMASTPAAEGPQDAVVARTDVSDRGGHSMWFSGNPPTSPLFSSTTLSGSPVGRRFQYAVLINCARVARTEIIGLSGHHRSGEGKAHAPSSVGQCVRTHSELGAHDGRTLAQRAEFGEGDRARQILHAAIGRGDQLVRTDEL
jgi:hypothetical protein